MRVLHVVDYFWPAIEWGGPVTSVRLLAAAQRACGAEVEVVTTNTRGQKNLEPQAPGQVEVEGLSVAYSRAFGPRRFFFSPGLAAELFRRGRAADVTR